MSLSRKTICIASGNHLCHNPRVLKEATTLARAGFDVEVLGGWVIPSLKARDQEMIPGLPFRFTSVMDFTKSDARTKFDRGVARLRRGASRLALRAGGGPSASLLGPAVGALRAAVSSRAADLFVAHSESALVVAGELLEAGRRVGLDMEDWYSEDLLPDARRARPIQLLRSLESTALRWAAYATCPSRGMSEALAREFECAAPTVVHNAFAWSDREALDGMAKDRRDRQVPSVHWYSQTLGPGRGLEDLMAALPLVRRDVEVHLRGNPVPGFEARLRAGLPPRWQERVFVHALVSNAELLSRIAEHDIGFAGEIAYCRNRDLTVTNKMLHYLLGGLAVIASDTAGQREVAALAPDAVSLYSPGHPDALAARIDALLDSPERLRHAKSAGLEAAERTYCWERQEGHLLEAVGRAFGDVRPRTSAR